MLVDIAALRDFILVVDAGSLTRAAALAGVSQPAMSQRIAQLETQVGHRLLERGPRGVEATAAGLELYRGAQQVVRQVDRLAESLGSGIRDIRGAVSVGLPSTVAPSLVPELVPLVAARHPGIRLELFESMSGYVEELLGRGRLDLAVLFRPDATDRPGEVALYEEELFLVTGTEVDPATEPASAAELVDRPLVAPGERSNLRHLVERFFTAAGVRPRVVADVESLAAMVRIAQTGAASAVLPRSVATAFTGPDLTLRPLRPAVRRTVAVCTAAEFYEPRVAVLAVRDAVVDAVHHLADRSAWPGIAPVRR
ncbi:LysR substrate-binding domain-containing protein [Nocardioides sp. NPDC092400]|uniref:LysR substrate-binding domain-containing protein n=1 Tax=Nocardioides sp. NPDC092400 TaxID=3155196 RepID=UPI0034466096